MASFTNTRIAEVLRSIADYLALEGDSLYRILAYQKAADLLADYPTSVADLARDGDLRTLPGIGEAIEQKIGELVQTGEISMLERLKERYPAGLLEIMRLPGVGAKTARRLWDEGHVGTVPELEDACLQGRIRRISGMGSKSETNLIRAIEAYRSRTGRRPLGSVDAHALLLLKALRDTPGVVRADCAGSIRRRRATVRDIDLVACGGTPAEIIRAFSRAPQLEEVSEFGETRLTGTTHTGLSIDLRAVDPASYGNLLQHSTGSAAHNVALRAYGQRHGYSLSEYSVEHEGSDRRIRCATEAEVYRVLDLDFIEPELREDRGELLAAAEGRLPLLVELTDLKGDLHVHSDWSDGRATMGEMARTAQALGLSYICFCDHSPSLGVARGLTPERLLAQIEAIGELNERLAGITVLAGSEVDILADGRLDLCDDLLARLDFVTASIHSGFSQSRDQIMHRLAAACRNPHVNVIGHPTGRLLGRREAYEVDIDALATMAAQTGTCLEINASYERLDLSSVNSRRARELGVKLIISSDAHAPADLEMLGYGIGEARRGWLEARDVANTLPLPDFLAAIRRTSRDT